MPTCKSGPSGFFRAIAASDASLAIIGVALVAIIATAFSEHFLTYSNLKSVTKSSTIIAVMAMGELLVIISGGIDISIGSTFGLAGTIAALLLADGQSVLVAGCAALAAGAAVGLINGLFIAKLNIVPFIVTLGMMGIVRGLNFIIADAQSIYLDSPAFLLLEQGHFLGIPLPICIAIAACVITHIFL
ncbi:MAG: ribose ABC transporter permease, partial [Planctomycetes bacterium]|nr:ribose ABC transporter permease [Planctomycetota bacterium]